MIYCRSKRRDTPIHCPSVRYSIARSSAECIGVSSIIRFPVRACTAACIEWGESENKRRGSLQGEAAKPPKRKLTARSLMPRSRTSSSRVSFGTFESSVPPLPAPTRSRGSYATFEPPSIAVPACAKRPSRSPSLSTLEFGVVGAVFGPDGLSSSGSTKPLLEVLAAATRLL